MKNSIQNVYTPIVIVNTFSLCIRNEGYLHFDDINLSARRKLLNNLKLLRKLYIYRLLRYFIAGYENM